jgi:hypothetical protein
MWTIESGKGVYKVKDVVVPKNYDKNDVFLLNRMKRTFFNCKNREFPAAADKIKVLKVELTRKINGI